MIGNRFPVDPLGDLPVSGLFDSLLRLALNPGVANIPPLAGTREAQTAGQALIIRFSSHGFQKTRQQKCCYCFSFLFVESGLAGPLLVELFYRVQIHNPVVRGSAPAL